jgi:hypothetical protein
MKRSNLGKIEVVSIITLCLILAFTAIDNTYAAVIGFEDLYPVLDKSATNAIPAGYAGFNWSSRFRLMTREYAAASTGVGYTNGMIGNVVAYTSGAAGANSVEMSSGDLFNFAGAYITSVWKMSQDVQVQGYYNGSLIYDTTIFTSSDRAYWFDFDFENIDRLRIVPGINGTDIYGTYRGSHLAIENITIVPEPATLMLLALGGLLIKRKR